MRLFGKKEKRSESGVTSFDDALLTALLGSSEITKQQAMEIPTVSACVGLIAEKISVLPLKLYEETNGEVREIIGDKRTLLINGDTSDTINGTELKKRWVIDYFLGKGAYTYIERGAGGVCGLYYVDESNVSVTPNTDPIHKSYTISVNGKPYFPHEFIKILRRTDGRGTGKSIVAENGTALAIAYNTMKFENNSVRKGGNKRGFLKAQTRLDKDTLAEVKTAWRRLYSNSNDNSDNIVVLNNGMEFQESSATSVEMQLNQNKVTNAAEICKIFGTPPEIISGRALETAESLFLRNGITPVINTIEAALDADLLRENEKGSRYFAFDANELTRGDFKKRMEGYAIALQNNIMQLDEVREREDLKPLGFNYIKLGLDSVLLDLESKTVYTPNTNQTAKLNEQEFTPEAEKPLQSDEERGIIEERKPYIDENTVIAVDFDGTLATNAYPKCGEPILRTIDFIRRSKEYGASIILWTCRTGKFLDDAVAWCAENGVPIDYVNENSPARIAKFGGDCRKISCDYFIDDKSLDLTLGELRAKDYIQLENGKMNGSRPSREKKTKYAPSPRREYEGITVSPKKYGILCGKFGTKYPQAKAGFIGEVSDGKYSYAVRKMDDNNSLSIMYKYKEK